MGHNQGGHISRGAYNWNSTVSLKETISLSIGSKGFDHRGIKRESHRGSRVGAVARSAWGIREDEMPVINGCVDVGETALWVSIITVCGAQLRADWRLVHQDAQFLLTQLQKLMYWRKAGWLESKRELWASSEIMHRRRHGCTGHFSWSERGSWTEQRWLIVDIHLLDSTKTGKCCNKIKILPLVKWPELLLQDGRYLTARSFKSVNFTYFKWTLGS